MKKRIMSVVCLFLAVLLLVCSLSVSVLASSDNGDTIVYVTRTGSKYHTGSCSYLRSSKIEKTLRDAVAQGYERCSRCNPPRYTGETSGQPQRSSSTQSSSSTSGTSRPSGSTPTPSTIPRETITYTPQQFDADALTKQIEAERKTIEESNRKIAEIEKQVTVAKAEAPKTTGSSKLWFGGLALVAIFVGYLIAKIKS